MNESNNTNNKRRRTMFLILLIFALLGAALFGYYFWQSSRLARIRWENQNPQVIISAPEQGQRFVSGQITTVSVLAESKHPIKLIEFWLDGQLIEILENESDQGTVHMGRVFDFLVEPGPHTIFARAVDSTGKVGQSLPVGITGTDPIDPSQVFTVSYYGPWIPLDKLAEDNQIDPGQIIDLNPDIFGEGSQEEGPIIIPVSPGSEVPTDSVASQPPIEGTPPSQVSGKICYPSEKIPQMTAYFQNTITKIVTTMPVSANQTNYSINLSPGVYTAYAWLPDKSLGGSYSKAVPCGLTTSCTDHTLIPFTVHFGGTTSGIDICDWYSPSSIPTPPQTPGGTAGVPSGQVSIPPGIPMLTVDQLEPVGNASSLPWAVLIPTTVPKAPTNFKASLKDCKIQVSWNSDPSDVTEYLVWYTGQNGILRLAATLKPPSSNKTEHWFEFSPLTSGKSSIWVDAVNAIGGQSSNPAVLTIPDKCGPEPEEKLVFNTMEVNTSEAYDRVYAYLSLEGVPEQRLPSDDSVFIGTEGGRGDISQYASGAQTYILPIPADEMLTVEGECWGWSGGELSQLSSFSETIPASNWDGGQGSLGNEKCAIRYGLQAHYSSGNTYETFAGKGGNIPAPFNVRVDRTSYADDTGSDWDDPFYYSWWFEREVFWQWTGEYKDISGFSIFLNGQKLKTVPAKERKTIVQIPSSCGLNNKWTVVANGKDGTSPTSQPFEEIKTAVKCGKYIKVTISAIRWEKTCDHWPCHFNYKQCDTLETYFTLSVNQVSKSFYGGNVFMPLACGKHAIDNLIPNPKDTIFILPYPDGYFDVYINAKFYDYDLIGSNDYLGAPTVHLSLADYDNTKKGLESTGYYAGNDIFYQYWSGGTHNGDVRMGQFRYEFSVYPNKLQHNP